MLSIQVLWFSLHTIRLNNDPRSFVVICFQFKFFDFLYTPNWRTANGQHCCDLLSIQVLWFSLHTNPRVKRAEMSVVICFQFKFFDFLYTPFGLSVICELPLWFAFNSSSLIFFTHRLDIVNHCTSCCDLLSIQVLWFSLHTQCLFNVSKLQLWFAFNSSSLIFFTHLHSSIVLLFSCCDLLSIQVLWFSLHT